jgi:hypothetical protein
MLALKEETSAKAEVARKPAASRYANVFIAADERGKERCRSVAWVKVKEARRSHTPPLFVAPRKRSTLTLLNK